MDTFKAFDKRREGEGGENINFDLSINRINQEISTRSQAHSKHFCVYQEGKYS